MTQKEFYYQLNNGLSNINQELIEFSYSYLNEGSRKEVENRLKDYELGLVHNFEEVVEYWMLELLWNHIRKFVKTKNKKDSDNLIKLLEIIENNTTIDCSTEYLLSLKQLMSMINSKDKLGNWRTK